MANNGLQTGSVPTPYRWMAFGYVEGENVAFEYRWAENDVNRLPELAADLVVVACGAGAAARDTGDRVSQPRIRSHHGSSARIWGHGGLAANSN